jgi:hypothetical protein
MNPSRIAPISANRKVVSIHRDLRPTLILLFCLGFDLFPHLKFNQTPKALLRLIVNIFQYLFLFILWTDCVLYKIYDAIINGCI